MKNRNLDYLKVDKSKLKPKRELIEEMGSHITYETIEFVKQIENEAYPESMRILQEARGIMDYPEIFSYFVSQITIARNVDWYIIYAENNEHIDIIDLASLPTRDIDASRKEIHDYIVNVINERALEGNKPIIASAKEDTSYKMFQRMIKNGEFELDSDIKKNWEYDDNITMHDIILKPIRQKERDEK